MSHQTMILWESLQYSTLWPCLIQRQKVNKCTIHHYLCIYASLPKVNLRKLWLRYKLKSLLRSSNLSSMKIWNKPKSQLFKAQTALESFQVKTQFKPRNLPHYLGPTQKVNVKSRRSKKKYELAPCQWQLTNQVKLTRTNKDKRQKHTVRAHRKNKAFSFYLKDQTLQHKQLVNLKNLLSRIKFLNQKLPDL